MDHNLYEAQKNLQVLFEFMLSNPDPDVETRFIFAMRAYRDTLYQSRQEALDAAKKKIEAQSC